jgi:hypothetical protein
LKLDFNSANQTFVLYYPRAEGNPRDLMVEHGLNFSAAGSTSSTAMLFTREPYAAASFADHATERAKAALIHITAQIDLSRTLGCKRHFDVPAERELYQFQAADVEYILAREHALDADPPGCGKTPTAIVVANEMQARKICVVCPASIRFQWMRKIKEWSTGPADGMIIRSSRYGLDAGRRWIIISWNLVHHPGLWRALAKEQFDLLILDEAHFAKEEDAKRTRSVFGGGHALAAEPLIERSKRVLALTGTPLPNRPREGYVLSRHLCWQAIEFMSRDDFDEKYNSVELHNVSGTDASGATVRKAYQTESIGRVPEFQNRLRAHFMCRHKKADAMPNTLPPIYDLIRVEETATVKAALAAERLLDIDPETFTGKDAAALGHIASARREMGLAIAPQAVKWCETLLRGGEDKIVLFAWHIEVLDILQAGLARYGVVRVDGRDSALSKDKKVQLYVAQDKLRVILGNVLSLGTGTDGLQHVASHCLIVEPDWVHGNNEQCVDRLYRDGQLCAVQADLFVAPGSISEKVLASALRKAQITDRALDRRW